MSELEEVCLEGLLEYAQQSANLHVCKQKC